MIVRLLVYNNRIIYTVIVIYDLYDTFEKSRVQVLPDSCNEKIWYPTSPCKQPIFSGYEFNSGPKLHFSGSRGHTKADVKQLPTAAMGGCMCCDKTESGEAFVSRRTDDISPGGFASPH